MSDFPSFPPPSTQSPWRNAGASGEGINITSAKQSPEPCCMGLNLPTSTFFHPWPREVRQNNSKPTQRASHDVVHLRERVCPLREVSQASAWGRAAGILELSNHTSWFSRCCIYRWGLATCRVRMSDSSECQEVQVSLPEREVRVTPH